MYINKIRLRNFRCYKDFTIRFEPRLTVIVAENGKGKTAILDGLVVAMAPFLSAFPGSKVRNFQFHDVRMVLDVPAEGKELGVQRMKYLLPVSLEAEGVNNANKMFSWERELKTLKGRTSSARAKVLSDYGRRLALSLNQPGDEKIILPVLGYYGTTRMWNDSSLLKGKAIDLSRSSGYVECLEPSGSYNTFGQWFRYASESELEYDRIIAEKKLPDKNPYRDILNAVRKAIIECIGSMGWTDLKYSFAAQNLLLCHPQKGELPLEAMSDGARSVISMAADIAYRMARLNPDLGENVALQTPGGVLIDEVDMHLHPSWQQTVFALGAESSQLLRDIQRVESRPLSVPIVKDLQRYLQLVCDDQWDSEEALALRKKLDLWSKGREPALIRADMDIRLRRFRRKK